MSVEIGTATKKQSLTRYDTGVVVTHELHITFVQEKKLVEEED